MNAISIDWTQFDPEGSYVDGGHYLADLNDGREKVDVILQVYEKAIVVVDAATDQVINATPTRVRWLGY